MIVTFRWTVVLYAVSTPDELIDAYDAPESIDHVGEMVFMEPSLM